MKVLVIQVLSCFGVRLAVHHRVAHWIHLFGVRFIYIDELLTGFDTGWLSGSTASCASTLKSNIIEAWKRRKKKNNRKDAWKRRKKRLRLKPVLPWLKPAHRLKPALTPAIAGLLESAMSWP
jgi:hypothetical protein